MNIENASHTTEKKAYTVLTKIEKDIEATHETIPKRCPSTPLQEASLFFHLWPIHQNPRAFLQVKAKITTNMSPRYPSDCSQQTVVIWWVVVRLQFFSLNISFQCSLGEQQKSHHQNLSRHEHQFFRAAVERFLVCLFIFIQITTASGHSYFLSFN